jgi:radical SAM superfamily enzyme YgiQ (UPF0313 family)
VKITFVELSAFEAILPLASGYMQAYAQQDPEVRDACEFEIYATSVETDPDSIVAELAGRRSDVYALSCYIWNMRLAQTVFDRLQETCPDAQFILGGPQVMNHAADYLPRGRENAVACNGEGERTFAEYVRQLLSPAPDLTAVPGLSFMRHGRLITTEPAPRIQDLTEVPSPFAAGLFEPGRYTTAILETNRGCPFRCGFCYWGAATNDRVHRFEEERIRSDIEWIAENRFTSLFIVDANWGMLRRDVELTAHLVECSQRHGFPLMVAMASAKNSPDRVAEITELLVRGGLLTSQPISLQTMSAETLDRVDRSNIKHSAYESLQRKLREKNISSYIELIWPLPGETLDSYREGIGELCRSGGDTLIVYPQLLLHNTPIYRNRDRLGVRVERVPSDVAEADVVVQTKWATKRDYEAGVWFFYALHSLYNLRGLYCVASLLERSGRSRFEETLQQAADFFQECAGDDPVCAFFAESVTSLGNYDYHNFGLVAHKTLHENRVEFDRLLARLIRSRGWTDQPAQTAFELDLVLRPYIYAEPFRLPEHDFEHLDLVPVEEGVEVRLSPLVADALTGLPDLALDLDGAERVRILHPQTRKLPYWSGRSLAHNASYCQGMILRLRELLPTLTTETRATDFAPVAA